LPTREHNVNGPWQGAFRDGWFDAVLSRYALRAAGAAHGLALTQLDRVAPGGLWRVAVEHTLDEVPDPRLFETGMGGRVQNLRLGPARDLEHTQALGRALFGATPCYRTRRLGRPSVEIPAVVEQELGVRVVLTSAGPTAKEKSIVD
jgi:adenylosuccinate synthase